MREQPGALLRQWVQERSPLIAPGVFDGLSAHLVRRAGFDAVYASGGAISRVLGYPDIGLIGLSEMANQLRYIVDAAERPVITDADTGYGGSMSTWRTVKTFGRVGVAALHIEDQMDPKRCGHLAGKKLIDPVEMSEKIIAAKEAAAEFEVLIIARTDAIAVEGFEPALRRAEIYAEAGADMLFVEAPDTMEQIRVISERVSKPKMLNMFSGGRTPLVKRDELAALGYNLIIIPSDLQRISIRSMEMVLQTIARDGDSASIADQFGPLSNRDEVVEAALYSENEEKYQALARRVGLNR